MNPLAYHSGASAWHLGKASLAAAASVGADGVAVVTEAGTAVVAA